MKKIKRICIITAEYPTEDSPMYTFVDQLVCEFADSGVQCTVLNPVSITSKILKSEILKPLEWYKTTMVGNTIKIVCPRFLSFSAKKICGFNTAKWTMSHYMRACLKWFEDNNKEFDAVYGHFIFPSAIVASKISELYGIPSFLAYGENTTYTIDYLGISKTKRLLKNINGVISVSTDNKEILLAYNLFSENQIRIFPNGVNRKIFYQRNKKDMRQKYHFSQDSFIVAFVGDFIHIKGANRLSSSITKLGTDRIKSIFIGKGEVVPTCEGILMQGQQPHHILPEILSAADIFVLPTLAEGCCNAIIEAMACGLPTVSSNLPFNDDILDGTCSIRINPNDVDEIATAIETLFKNKNLRKNLAEGALKKAQQLDIETRSKNIIEFMESKILYDENNQDKRKNLKLLSL